MNINEYREKWTPIQITTGTGADPMPIETIIASRAKTHGDWTEVARISNGIKALLRSGPSWQSMTPSQQEAMDMDATKQARIVCGNPNEPDHWRDRIGYATLALDELE